MHTKPIRICNNMARIDLRFSSLRCWLSGQCRVMQKSNQSVAALVSSFNSSRVKVQTIILSKVYVQFIHNNLRQRLVECHFKSGLFLKPGFQQRRKQKRKHERFYFIVKTASTQLYKHKCKYQRKDLFFSFSCACARFTLRGNETPYKHKEIHSSRQLKKLFQIPPRLSI